MTAWREGRLEVLPPANSVWEYGDEIKHWVFYAQERPFGRSHSGMGWSSKEQAEKALARVREEWKERVERSSTERGDREEAYEDAARAFGV